MGSDLVGVGPCGSPEAVICRSFSSSLRGISLLEEASPHSIPRPAFGTYLNGLRNEDDGNGYSIEQDTASLPLGYEVTFATTDRQGLLKYFTSALSDSNLQLNIKVCYFFLTMHIPNFFMWKSSLVFVTRGRNGRLPFFDASRSELLSFLQLRLLTTACLLVNRKLTCSA